MWRWTRTATTSSSGTAKARPTATTPASMAGGSTPPARRREPSSGSTPSTRTIRTMPRSPWPATAGSWSAGTARTRTAATQGIYRQEYTAAGAPDGGELLVNTFTNDDQTLSAVAMDDNGGYVVAWSGEGPGDSDGVFWRRFATATAGTISGTVYHDVDGDGDLAGATTFAGATVHLFRDLGIGTIDVLDLLQASAVTSPTGTYSFAGLGAGTYYVVVDSRTLGATNTWAEQTYGSAGSALGAAFTTSDGALFGGREHLGPDTSDSVNILNPTTAEHITKVTLTARRRRRRRSGLRIQLQRDNHRARRRRRPPQRGAHDPGLAPPVHPERERHRRRAGRGLLDRRRRAADDRDRGRDAGARRSPTRSCSTRRPRRESPRHAAHRAERHLGRRSLRPDPRRHWRQHGPRVRDQPLHRQRHHRQPEQQRQPDPRRTGSASTPPPAPSTAGNTADGIHLRSNGNLVSGNVISGNRATASSADGAFGAAHRQRRPRQHDRPQRRGQRG